jgi:hypothetical protein
MTRTLAMRPILPCVFFSALVAAGVSQSQQLGQEEPPVLYRCDRNAASGERKPATYSGFYEAEFESSSFKLSRVPCEVWLSGDVCPIFGKGKCAKGAKVKAYVTVEGVLSEPGHFGHFGLWERELRVTRVIKVQRIKE